MSGDVKQALESIRTEIHDVEERLDARLDGVEARLDGVGSRLDGVDSRLDGVDSRLDGLDSRLDGLDSRLDGLDVKIDGVEKRLSKTIYSEISRALGVIEERFASLFGLLDEKHGQRIDDLRKDLDEHRADTTIHLAKD